MNNTTRQFPAAFGSQRGGRGAAAGAGRREPYRGYNRTSPKEEPVKKQIDLNSEMNFPALNKEDDGWKVVKSSSSKSEIPATAGAGIPSGSFAALAQKWKESDDDEESRKKYEAEKIARDVAEHERYSRTFKILGNSRSRHEDTYEEYDTSDYNEYDDEDLPPIIPHENDGWATVDKKKIVYRPTYATSDCSSGVVDTVWNEEGEGEYEDEYQDEY
jgi:hypothetical protein